MRHIPQHEIPALPVQDIFNGECVAFGVGNSGVIIQFMEREDCILIEWPDVIMFGFELLKAPAKKAEEEIEEISAPTVVE